MITNERSKRLVEGNNASLEVLLSKPFTKVGLDHIGNDSRHRLVEVGIISEEWANPFGEADDPLTIRYRWQNFIQEELDQFLLSIGMTAMAKATAPATQGNKHILSTTIAMKASQAKLGQPTLQQGLESPQHLGAQVTSALYWTLLGQLLQRAQLVIDDLIPIRQLRATSSVAIR